ncbi:hypothetical protein RHMOL_Rhmol02G0177600 [Rhododendron molle]|uniref:Uncharacterized protein n=1 Tax=Rhododendron molle TaxID=49168 RepID=A0ACC0PRG1_RHOML|nr:hypothetical protein RHMOL_Rhmol02G0177600 [Rhododendron molle]
MDNSRLAACVEALEAEMAYYRGEIEELNTQIARLITTIRSLRRAMSNLQDFCFNQLDDKDDPESVPGHESEESAEDSEGNPNCSDNRSDNVNDASDGGSD